MAVNNTNNDVNENTFISVLAIHIIDSQLHILFTHGICKERMNDKMHSLLQYIQGGFGNNLFCERISSTVVKCMHYHTKLFVQLYVFMLQCGINVLNTKILQIQTTKL